jgi:hypothetical protein
MLALNISDAEVWLKPEWGPVIFVRGCVKRFSPPAAAKYSLDGDIFFLILRSKIRKKMSPSKFNLARSAKKNLFTQPRYSRALFLQNAE